MTTELTWDATDWESADEQAGLRVDNSDGLRQGFDLDESPLSDATSYWPLDDPADAGATTADVVGPNDGERNGSTPGANGILSTNGERFDNEPNVTTEWTETDYVCPEDGVASFAYFVTYRNPDGSNRVGQNDTDANARFYGGKWSDADEILFGLGDSTGRIFTADPVPSREWHFVGLSGDGSTATGFFNDQTTTFDYAYGSNPDDLWFTLGATRQSGDNNTVSGVTGRMSDIAVWDRALSDDEMRAVRDTVSDGSLTTQAKSPE